MSDETRTYVLELGEAGGACSGRLRGRNRRDSATLDAPALGADAEITIRGESHTLGSLVKRLADFEGSFLKNVFDERGQLELGQHLYEQTFGQLPDGGRDISAEDAVRVRVVTTGEHLSQLPWVLLARDGVFLSTTGWSVELTDSADPAEAREVELPPSPSILFVVTEAAGYRATEGEEHLAELETMLSAADRQHVRGRRLHVAPTWALCRELLASVRPNILYFYGHGRGDLDTSKLVFADGPARDAKLVPMIDLAQELRAAAADSLRLAYINCCQGESGGALGAGHQLGKLVPAVVANRTQAQITTARRQALELLRAIVVEGLAPHEAVAGLYARLGELDLSFGDPRWMTPVLHASYGAWAPSPPPVAEAGDRDPYRDLKLDRELQSGPVTLQVREMLRIRRPTSRAYVWYGMKGQGVELLHERLKVELRADTRSTHVYVVRPKWPDDLQDPQRSFADMICDAFEVGSLEGIPGRIREQTRGESGRRILVYICHTPLHAGHTMTLDALGTYLEWWDARLTDLVERGQSNGMMGFPFVVQKPDKFELRLRKTIDGLRFRRIRYEVLQRLGNVRSVDLVNFLEDHGIRLPPDRRSRIVAEILEQTGGAYEATVEALRDIESRAWDLPADDSTVRGDVADDDDW